MIRALYSAASGMTAQQINVDNIAHNLANANTAGYKMRRAQFQDLDVPEHGPARRFRQPADHGSQLACSSASARAPLSPTKSSSRRAISPQTDNPSTWLSRARDSSRSANPPVSWPIRAPVCFNSIATAAWSPPNGDPLEPQITIPAQAQSITIGQDGTVSYTLPGQSQATHGGQIQLATFRTPPV